MKCEICNREFKHVMSLNVHKTLKHDPNYIPPSRCKENNPMYGKKGSNQYIKNPLPSLLEREFETI